ncbi:MAG: cysteine desulfurase family protein [Oligoflexia bacterium]|nr:cysteine desulfurase family protein [Oligoflexia bacterium]
MNSRIYLDYNATTPLHPELVLAVTQAIAKFGNPSSVHWAGRESKKAISMARENISKFLNIDPLEIVFTAGGSEANNLVLKGAIGILAETRREIISSTVEHPSVLKTMDYLKKKGFIIKWLKVSKDGSVDLTQLDTLLTPQTGLVTIQLVNNETGNIFPLKEITSRAHSVGALVHSDMVQALGKIPIDLKDLGVDFASFAGHKFYSLKGSGFLYVKSGKRLESLIHGGGQERSRRAGTENTLAISSLGEAVKILGPRINETSERLKQFRDQLEEKIKTNISDCFITGDKSLRVANTINVTFSNTDGETLLINLDTQGFAVSSGAACSSGSQEPSPVLTAMGLTSEEASQSLRISLGWLTTQEEVSSFYEALIKAITKMREANLQLVEREDKEMAW